MEPLTLLPNLLFIVTIFLTWQVSWSIRLVEVGVPIVIYEGKSATLRCIVDLEGEQLYSLKWYKDNEEFFRYMPRGMPPISTYHVEGIQVDKSQSNQQQVVLRPVTLAASGVYRCEASAEKPSFSSVRGDGLLSVIIPPRRKPQIAGSFKTLQRMDVAMFNCTADGSRPPAVIRWYLNHVQANAKHVQTLPSEVADNGLEMSVSSLQMPLDESIPAGTLIVTCEASIPVPSQSRSTNNNYRAGSTGNIMHRDRDVTGLSAWVDAGGNPHHSRSGSGAGTSVMAPASPGSSSSGGTGNYQPKKQQQQHHQQAWKAPTDPLQHQQQSHGGKASNSATSSSRSSSSTGLNDESDQERGKFDPNFHLLKDLVWSSDVMVPVNGGSTSASSLVCVSIAAVLWIFFC